MQLNYTSTAHTVQIYNVSICTYSIYKIACNVSDHLKEKFCENDDLMGVFCYLFQVLGEIRSGGDTQHV